MSSLAVLSAGCTTAGWDWTVAVRLPSTLRNIRHKGRGYEVAKGQYLIDDHLDVAGAVSAEGRRPACRVPYAASRIFVAAACGFVRVRNGRRTWQAVEHGAHLSNGALWAAVDISLPAPIPARRRCARSRYGRDPSPSSAFRSSAGASDPRP